MGGGWAWKMTRWDDRCGKGGKEGWWRVGQAEGMMMMGEGRRG